ncbi:MAG TPA: phosphoribosylaminoimidazolecarboxamide formyltransferase [Sphaerochaeta sp.]|nr:phosphoribosylaminoimidazolecarboxamide formyltransferase [Sphaerochaeta sp.]HQB54326.1 phosphoribosylaminoimidazolecarboxamide formyltransferase [Sphaerochaeta sp.]
MEGMNLKYGCNPNQRQAALLMESGTLPIQTLNGEAGYINLLDALNGWQLVRELKEVTDLPSATSFKHVSPAGAAIGLPLNEEETRVFDVPKTLSPIASAYIRARSADPLASFGDFVAISDGCDLSLAKVLKREVSDGIIAPSYTPEALELLKTKKRGRYVILQVNPEYEPPLTEKRTLFGMTLMQERNTVVLDSSLLRTVVTKQKDLPPEAIQDLLVGMVTLKYTQSNSVCYTKGGQAIGVGAGQQSRIACTRLAGEKADLFHLRFHPKLQNLRFDAPPTRQGRYLFIEEGIRNETLLSKEEQRSYLNDVSKVSLASDAFFPFRDNIDRAAQSGVTYIAQAGGSTRDKEVIQAADEHKMVMCMTSIRLFHH